MLPLWPPDENEAYEWPPLFAWTLTPFLPAHTTASETCCVVVGRTSATGVYGKRKLKGWTRLEKSEDVTNRIGTAFPVKQSPKVVEAGGGPLTVHVPKPGWQPLAQ